MADHGSSRTTKRRCLIALAVVAVVLPPWPSTGTPSHEAALYNAQLTATVSQRLADGMARICVALRLASPGVAGRPAGLPTGEAGLEVPDRDGESDEVPADADDLAEAAESQVLVAGRRGERVREPSPTSAFPAARRDARPSPAAPRRVADCPATGRDLPTFLCRLNC